MAQLDQETKLPESERAGTARYAAPPIVIEDKKSKKKKRRYSRGLRAVQDLERGVTRSLETVTDGVARVFSEYSKRRNASSRKKRDGAIRDGIENWSRAVGKGMRVASKAPYRFVKAVNRGRASKQLRDTVRALTPPPLR